MGKAWSTDSSIKEGAGLVRDLYEQSGAKLLGHCDGQFAAAIIDEPAARAALVVNWPGGVYPLYYCVSNDVLRFASRLHLLIRLCGGRPRVNEGALIDLFRFGGIFSEETLFAGIHRVIPGTAIIFEHGRIAKEAAWTPPANGTCDPPDAEEFFAIYDGAIQRRVSGSEEVGAFLSGGLDSSMNVGTMAAHVSGRVKTFSIRFGSSGFDESPWSRLIAKTFNTQHHELILDDADCLARLPEMVWGMEEPIADYSYIPTFFLAEYAKKHVGIVMAGDGADHLLGRDYGRAAWRWLLRSVPGASAAAVWLTADGVVDSHIRTVLWSVLRRARAGRQAWMALSAAHPMVQRAVLSGHRSPLWGVLPPNALASLLSASLMKRAAGNLSHSIEMAPLPGVTEDPFDSVVLADTATAGVCGVFTKVGKMCEVNNLALREPFLAAPLARYVLRLAKRWKVQGGFAATLLNKIPHTSTKLILRRAAEKRLPIDILTKPKHGFEPPLAEWLCEATRGLTAEQVFGSLVRKTDWFNVRFMDRMLAEHRSGKYNHHYLVMLLAAFDQWHRIYLEGEPEQPTWKWSDCFSAARR